ncbi:sugar transporter stl1 [Diplodia corticola]|uniref:Sugar transporter stl1 n=1 Tax=Diplodia corticola TaxID=236234 RepID=A0A1J9S6S5_9PEZI|nr:sugar transporter stl1 [Diplodia corticola]OJD35309.1 sugar transporter stl1 [Diplodia corticola]
MCWFGYDQGVFSGVLISKDFIDQFPETKNANVNGITSSCFSLSAFIGCLFAFTAGDYLGRRRSNLIGLAANVIGAILQIFAFHLPQMLIGRLINGFGMGIITSVVPVYQSECAKPHVRGRLVILANISNTLAFCLANWINYALFFSHGGGAFQWRFPLAFQLVFALVSIPIVAYLPESPRWLMLQERAEEAIQVIARLEGAELSETDPVVVATHRSIGAAIEEERRARMPVRDVLLFRDGTQNFRRVLLSCGTQLMQQFSGVNALGYYLPTLLQESVGFDERKSRLLAACNATSYFGAALVCLCVIDMVGRRKLMLYGALSAGSCYLVAAICLKMADLEPESKYELGSATTATFFLYYAFYGTSFAKVPWVYNSEINSLGWRTRGAAAATATNWIGSFIVTQFTKVGVQNLGWRFYLLFACFLYSYFPVVWALYPETTQRTLEDMDEIFKRNPGIFVFGNKDLTQRARPRVLVEAEIARVQRAAEENYEHVGGEYTETSAPVALKNHENSVPTEERRAVCGQPAWGWGPEVPPSSIAQSPLLTQWGSTLESPSSAMSHLVPVDDPLLVPYLVEGIGECDESFFNELRTDDDGVLSRIRRGDVSELCGDDVAPVLQQWMFFGLMRKLLGPSGISVDQEDFLSPADGCDGCWVSTSGVLPLYLMYWSAAEVDAEDSAERDKKTLLRQHLDALRFVNSVVNAIIICRRDMVSGQNQNEGSDEEVEDVTDNNTCLEISVLDTVILSIVLLSEALLHAATQIFNLPEKVEGLKWNLDNALRFRLTRAGWCPGEISFLHQRLVYASSLYLVSSMDRKYLSKTHDACDEDGCKANQIDEGTYQTKHETAGCVCDHVAETSPDGVTQAVKVLDNGDIPVIRILEDDGGYPNRTHIQVDSFGTGNKEATPYVAISHVWSDGLGNPRANSLPRCQLLRIQRYVDDLYGEEYEKPIPFWIDTICVPLERSSRKKAIRRMGDTYRFADKVLVLDSWLLTTPMHTYREMNLLRIKCCTWTQRLWTLQETMMARHRGLVFQTCEGAFSEEDFQELRWHAGHELLHEVLDSSLDFLKDRNPQESQMLCDLFQNVPEVNSGELLNVIQGPTRRDLLLGFVPGIDPNAIPDVEWDRATSVELCRRLVGWSARNFVFHEGHNYFVRTRWTVPGAQDTSPTPAVYTNALAFIGYGMSDRSTSKLEDEPICLATLLGQDLDDLLDEPDVERRMRIVMSKLTWVTSVVLFSPGPRMEVDGFKWAPKSFLVGGEGFEPDLTFSSKFIGSVAPEGLLIKLNGVIVESPVPIAAIICGADFVVDVGHARLHAAFTDVDVRTLPDLTNLPLAIVIRSIQPGAAIPFATPAWITRVKERRNGMCYVEPLCRMSIVSVFEGSQHDRFISGNFVEEQQWCVG